MSIKSIYDTFDAEILRNLEWCGQYDFPKLKPCTTRPRNLISYDHKHDHVNRGESWLHFYVHDKRFMPILKCPSKDLELFSQFEGLIGLDRSIYWDLPLSQQISSVFCNRILDAFWQGRGFHICPNISWGDWRSFPWCCDGIEPRSVVAVSSHGTVRDRADRHRFLDGLFRMAEILRPRAVIHHGVVLPDVRRCADEWGFELVPFESRTATAHRKAVS